MIYHYGIFLSPHQLRNLLGLPEGVEISCDSQGYKQILFDIRSDAPFDINGVEASDLDKMPWTNLDDAIAQRQRMRNAQATLILP